MDGSKIGKWQEKPDSYKRLTIAKALQLSESKIIKTIDLSNEQPFKFFEDYGIPQPVSWLVPQYITDKGVTIITGRAGCGKSLIIEEMISAILNKRKWFNSLPIIQDRPIILIDMENDHSTLYERLQKLGGIPEKKLMVFNFELSFDIQTQFTEFLMKEIEKLDPCMVIFDTLRRTYSGDENDSKVINDIYRNYLAPIAKKRAVIIIAHARKSMKGANNNIDDELSEVRGTGDITGLASATLKLTPNVDDTITIKPIKMRCAKKADPFNVRLIDKDNKFTWEMSKLIAERSEIEVLLDDLFDWLKHNTFEDSIITTNQILNAMKPLGNMERTIFRAIKTLDNKGILIKLKKGKYKFNFGNQNLNDSFN
jgi:ABC-type dipeptide/oligopeptide/nickel transport system ATPase component